MNLNDNLPKALNTITEAIDLYKPLAERLPQRFTEPLFLAYRTLADVLDGHGRVDEADHLRQQLDEALADPEE